MKIDTFGFTTNPCTLSGNMSVVVLLVLVVMYMGVTCQSTCQLSPFEKGPMCMSGAKSSIAHVELLRYNTSTMNGLVPDCPNVCKCKYFKKGTLNFLAIADCESDPCDELPKVLDRYKNVDELILLLYNASLVTFPCQVSVLTKLLQLYIYLSPMQNISCDLSAMRYLQVMYIKGTRLTHVPGMLFTTQLSLYGLLLPGYAISTVTVPSSGLNSLLNIDLSDNHIHTFPEGLLQLSKLEKLNVGNNKLRKVPALSRLPELQWLNVSHNPLATIPSNLSDLSKLICLDLSHTNNPWPGEGLLPRTLRILWLSSINITNTGSLTLPALQLLDLSYNNLTKTPSAVLALGAINSLDLSYNQLHSLYSVQPNQPLWCLDQSHNSIQLAKIDTFYLFLVIQTIILDYNRITQISFAFDEERRKQTLVYMGLSHNRLTSLDSWPLYLTQSNPGVQINLDQNSIATFTNRDGYGSSKSCNAIVSGKISLKHNNISHFMDVFNGWNLRGSTLGELQTCLDKALIDISDNPLICDCIDYEIYNHMHESKSMVLTCSKPETLSGKNPMAIPLDSFVCHVYNDCPQGCACYKCPNTNSILLVCDDYTDTDIPTVLPRLPLGYKYHLNLTHGHHKQISFNQYLRQVHMALFSHNAITVISREVLLVLVNIQVVHLDNNRLERLSEDIASVKLNSTTELTLSRNRWKCDCPAFSMKNWLLDNGQNIPDSNSIVCQSPKSASGQKMIHLDSGVFCPNSLSVGYIVLICAGTFILLTIIVAIAIVVIRWKQAYNVPNVIRPAFRTPPKDECENEKKEFDVYMSYDTYYDEDYVEGQLIPGLEERGYKVCSSMIHADPCRSEIYNLYSCINRSKRVLVFFSKALKKNNLAFNEWTTAFDLDIHNGRKRLVTILDWDVEVNDLDYSQTQYFEMRGSVIVREDKKFWEFIAESLAVKRMGDPPVVQD